ncbi:carbohydrate ABC transporter permease [Kitasatospora sp. NPDC058965]|uniref:carbohydrate ABC transporter permease n=1 Tax=Kitasatospora sp. NPDC058965 TaxID=3346682 RepID=UPI0036CA023F
MARRIGVTSRLVPWLFLLPALTLFTVFKFVPMARALTMSTQEVRPYLGDQWVGGANYAGMAGNPAFLDAFWHTALLAVGSTAGSVVIGFVLALLLEGQARHLWFVRSAVFLPVVATMAAVAEVWRLLYYPAATGPINSVLGALGLGPSEFLNSPHSSLVSILVMEIWKGAPYDMMIILAGLASIDRALYEAASIDGAGTWRRLRHVVVPHLKPVFLIVVTLAAVRSMRVFTEVFLLTNGGPDGSSEVLMTLIYKVGLERSDLGLAAAGSVALFAVTLALTLLVRLTRGKAATP